MEGANDVLEVEETATGNGNASHHIVFGNTVNQAQDKPLQHKDYPFSPSSQHVV